MCKNCTKPWSEDDEDCIVGDNGLKYHNLACYQTYLDSIEKVSFFTLFLQRIVIHYWYQWLG
jgi:hypothetical protein